MVKSSTLLFVLFFAFLFHLEPFSLRLLLVILLITTGVFLMVFNTTDIAISGLIMVFSASALAGLRWALTELVMHKKAMGLSNPFATIFWLAPIMAVALALFSLGVEGWGNVFGNEHWEGTFGIVSTVGIIALPGSMAFAMVACEYL
jgi:solute carrier family 35 protein C2